MTEDRDTAPGASGSLALALSRGLFGARPPAAPDLPMKKPRRPKATGLITHKSV
jgi:hypothetical protein